MSLETITREEFDKRLEAANDRAEAELQKLEQENQMLQHLIEQYEALRTAEAQQDRISPRVAELRHLLLQLADSSLEAAQAL